MLFVVVAFANRRHTWGIPRFATVATAEMIVLRRYTWSGNALDSRLTEAPRWNGIHTRDRDDAGCCDTSVVQA